MDAEKFLRVKLAFDGSQRLTNHPGAFPGVKMNVFVIGFYPIDFAGLKKGDTSIRANNDAIQVFLLSPDAFEERSYLQAFVFFVLRMEAFFGILERGLEPNLVERFEQVIERMKLEGPDRVRFIGCRKNNFRQVIEPDRVQNRKPIHFRHLDVEKDKVRLFLPDRRDGFSAVTAFGDDLDFGILFQHPANELARE